MEALETFQVGRFKIEIYQDLDAPDPTSSNSPFEFPSEEEIQQWKNGEVYGYVITDNLPSEQFLVLFQIRNIYDSCWGFYEFEYCKQEATNIAQAMEDKHIKNEGIQLKLLIT